MNGENMRKENITVCEIESHGINLNEDYCDDVNNSRYEVCLYSDGFYLIIDNNRLEDGIFKDLDYDDDAIENLQENLFEGITAEVHFVG